MDIGAQRWASGAVNASQPPTSVVVSVATSRTSVASVGSTCDLVMSTLRHPVPSLVSRTALVAERLDHG